MTPPFIISDTSPWPSVTPLSPQPTSLLTAGRSAFSPLALATRTHVRTHVRTHARTHARTHPPGTCPSHRSISKGRSRLGVTCLRPWPASITPRRWRRCALPLTLLRRPVAEVGWSPASSCSRPSALRHLLRPGVHCLRPEGPGHRGAHRQCQLEVRPPPPWVLSASRPAACERRTPLRVV